MNTTHQLVCRYLLLLQLNIITLQLGTNLISSKVSQKAISKITLTELYGRRKENVHLNLQVRELLTIISYLMGEHGLLTFTHMRICLDIVV